MTRRTALLAILIAVAALAAPAGAAAQWRTEAVPGDGVLSPLALSFDARGRGLFSWEGFLQPNRKFTGLDVRAPSGGWTRPANLSGITWGGAQIHLFGTSRALLLANQTSSLGAYNRARFRLVWAFGHSDGTFHDLKTLSENATQKVSAANASGAAMVAWLDRSGVTKLRELPAGSGTWGSTRTLSPGGVSAAAMNSRGDRVLAWSDRDGIKARVRRSGGSWGKAKLAAAVTPVANTHVRAVVTTGGRIVLAWDSASVREDRPAVLRAGVALLDVGGSWKSYALEHSTVRSGGVSEGSAAIPIAIDSKTYVAWTGAANGATNVKFARVVADGPRTATLLSPDVRGAGLNDAAAGPNGDVVVSWSVLTPRSTVTYASLRRGDEAFEPPAKLTPDDVSGIVTSRAAFHPLTGEAVVTWGYSHDQQLLARASVSPPGLARASATSVGRKRRSSAALHSSSFFRWRPARGKRRSRHDRSQAQAPGPARAGRPRDAAPAPAAARLVYGFGLRRDLRRPEAVGEPARLTAGREHTRWSHSTGSAGRRPG